MQAETRAQRPSPGLGRTRTRPALAPATPVPIACPPTSNTQLSASISHSFPESHPGLSFLSLGGKAESNPRSPDPPPLGPTATATAQRVRTLFTKKKPTKPSLGRGHHRLGCLSLLDYHPEASLQLLVFLFLFPPFPTRKQKQQHNIAILEEIIVDRSLFRRLPIHHGLDRKGRHHVAQAQAAASAADGGGSPQVGSTTS